MRLQTSELLIVDVPDYLFVDNDAAVGGRLPLLVECPACGDPAPRFVGMLGPGRWLVDHQHGGHWSATQPGVVPRAGGQRGGTRKPAGSGSNRLNLLHLFPERPKDDAGMIEHLDRPLCTVLGCERPQSPGWTICATDGIQMADWLNDLPDLYRQLDAHPDLPSPSAARDGRGGGSLKSMRSPALLDVIVLRDGRSKERSIYDPDGNRGRGVLEVLTARAWQVREDRKIPRPTRTFLVRRPGAVGPLCEGPCLDESCDAMRFPVTYPTVLTIASEGQVLVDELDWVRAQEWAAEFHAELAELAEQLDRGMVHVVHPGPRCRELHDGEQCTGHVRTTGPSSVRCSSCGTVTAGLALVRRYGAGAVA